MNTIHAMIDIETLATTDDAVITQIGLVFFDINVPRHDGMHEWIVSAQFQKDRRVDGDTMNWHLDAPERVEQLRRSYALTADPLSLALRGMVDELKGSDPAYIWAKSPTFDLRILEHAIRDTPNLELPWAFYQERDVRTAFHLLETAGTKPVLKKSHRAIDDALEQADWVARALRMARECSSANTPVDEPADITREPEPAA